MPAPRHLLLRSARDRLIDLLGLGETYPLEDVGFHGDSLTVAFDRESTFDVEPGQLDVDYEIEERTEEAGKAPGPWQCAFRPESPPSAYGGVGKGDPTELTGPVVQKDVGFRLHAWKTGAPTPISPNARAAYVKQTASVKVGLDRSLRARIEELPLLDAMIQIPHDDDPRIAAHGASAKVRVVASQAGADYRLVYTVEKGRVVETTPTLSPGGDLLITTAPAAPVAEDTTFAVRARRQFSPTDIREETLDVHLPLAVRANPTIGVSVSGSSFSDPEGPVGVALSPSQSSVKYTLYARRLQDRDFRPQAGENTIRLNVPDPLAGWTGPAHAARALTVRAPPSGDVWQLPEGYAQAAPTAPGNDAIRLFKLEALPEDTLVIVRAHKDHFAGPKGTSDVGVRAPALVLPRPHSAPKLAFALVLGGDGKSDALQVTGGQQGVFYHVRVPGETQPAASAAYFHRTDEADPRRNVGIGRLRIGLDLVITRSPSAAGGATPNPPEYTPPLEPILALSRVPQGTIEVMAVRARTGVGWAKARVLAVKPRSP